MSSFDPPNHIIKALVKDYHEKVERARREWFAMNPFIPVSTTSVSARAKSLGMALLFFGKF